MLKNFERGDISSFSSSDIRMALVGQGCTYKIDDIENALKFLSTQPFSILQKQNDKYFLTDRIESILKKSVYYSKRLIKWVVEYKQDLKLSQLCLLRCYTRTTGGYAASATPKFAYG